MISDRTRGAVLYASVTALLVLGGLWWVRSAPQVATDPQLAAWQETVERVIPSSGRVADSGTLALAADASRDVRPAAEPGRYELRVACAGGRRSAVGVTLNTDADDSRRVRCSEDPAPVSIFTAVPATLEMSLSVDEDGPVVFRWSLSST